MVTRQLNTHPRISFAGALFSRKGWAGEGKFRKQIRRDLNPDWDELNFRVKHHSELLDRIFSCAEPDGCSGFKHHLNGAPEITQSVVADATVATILLTRQNILACYSSNLMVEVKWVEDFGFAGSGKARFQAKAFEQYARARRNIYEKWQKEIEANPGLRMTIDYTEARTVAGIQRIMTFLNLDGEGLKLAPTLKRNSDNLAERFENPDDVRAYLRTEGLEDWLEEREPSSGDVA